MIKKIIFLILSLMVFYSPMHLVSSARLLAAHSIWCDHPSDLSSQLQVLHVFPSIVKKEMSFEELHSILKNDHENSVSWENLRKEYQPYFEMIREKLRQAIQTQQMNQQEVQFASSMLEYVPIRITLFLFKYSEQAIAFGLVKPDSKEKMCIAINETFYRRLSDEQITELLFHVIASVALGHKALLSSEYTSFYLKLFHAELAAKYKEEDVLKYDLIPLHYELKKIWVRLLINQLIDQIESMIGQKEEVDILQSLSLLDRLYIWMNGDQQALYCDLAKSYFLHELRVFYIQKTFDHTRADFLLENLIYYTYLSEQIFKNPLLQSYFLAWYSIHLNLNTRESKELNPSEVILYLMKKVNEFFRTFQIDDIRSFQLPHEKRKKILFFLIVYGYVSSHFEEESTSQDIVKKMEGLLYYERYQVMTQLKQKTLMMNQEKCEWKQDLLCDVAL